MKRSGSILVAFVVVVSVTGSVAFGGSQARFDSTVTLSALGPFHGKVLSKRAACKRDRLVSVFRVEQGEDGLFGSTRSDGSGKWKIEATPNGDFYAIVKRRAKKSGDTVQVCRSDRSKTKHFGT